MIISQQGAGVGTGGRAGKAAKVGSSSGTEALGGVREFPKW